jgi:hypothetical protein
LWVRDEQIAQNIKRIPDRIEAYPEGEKRSEPIAIVAFGPSLNETWEQIRQFKYIMTGSGSHKFLLERGIVPTWQCEVDPRAHKVDLMGPPHSDVEYLIASCCSPKVLDHLEGHKVKLWHVFSNEEESFRVLPPGEWAIFGGSNVGLRQMTIARFLGFTKLHIFGMDGCFGASGTHSSAHPNSPPKKFTTEYGGKVYDTTPAYLTCAKQTFHELNQMPDVRAVFYGDGLVQAMAKDYRPKYEVSKPAISIQKEELISAEYREQNKLLHETNISYGVGGGKHAELVQKLVKAGGYQSILDYGAGKMYLAKKLPFPIWSYDPAIPEIAAPPRPADLVCCTDVLEHIEPEKLAYVLADLRRCVQKVGFFTINTGPAKKTLPDGRNTHLIQKNKEWWISQLNQFFTIGKVFPVGGADLYVLVGPKTSKKKKKVEAKEEASHA